MKRIGLFLILGLVLSFAMYVPSQAQQTKAGTFAFLGSFKGLGDLGVGPYNGGLGAKLYLSKDMAIRGGALYSQVDNGETVDRSYNLNASVTFDFAKTSNTTAYFGGEGLYNHANNVLDSYGFGALAGFEVFVLNNVSLGGEGKFEYATVANGSTKTFNLTGPSGLLTVAIYFNTEK